MYPPRTLKVNLERKRYYLEVNAGKCEYCRERIPHWHLFFKKKEIGSISANGIWLKTPSTSPEVRKEVEYLTHCYAPEIDSVYKYGREYCFDD